MTKYIDAEKLTESINGLMLQASQAERLHLLTKEQEVCIISQLSRVLSFIDSLQQEQSDFPTTDEQIKEFLATHPKVEVPNKYKTPDWLWKKQEQPKVDLEKEIRRYLHEECSGDDEPTVSEIARHFCEFGLRKAAEMYDEIEYNKQRAEEE